MLCGQFVVFTLETFHRERKGLMRADADGAKVTKLAGGHVRGAACSPDGKFIFYDTLDRPQKIRKVAVEGGTPIEIAEIPVDGFESHLTLSRDGRSLAYLYRESFQAPAPVKLVVIPAAGGPPLKQFSVPGGILSLRWSPDGRGLQYTLDIFAGAAGNIWEQPLAGGKPKQLTNFTSGQIYDFSLSADGKHLLMTRGVLNGDVVLLSGLR